MTRKFTKELREIRPRDPQEIRSKIYELQSSLQTFQHIHSKYTDTILHLNHMTKYLSVERSVEVFKAYRRIVRDLKNNPVAHDINRGKYSTENYANMEEQAHSQFIWDRVINLDISCCYPFTAFIHKLISRDTLDHLLFLDKDERLPALGMLAYNRMIYEYVDGQLTDLIPLQGEWSNIFYYIIQTVNETFLNIRQLAGEYYIMHWVDGLFLRPDIPEGLLNNIRNEFISRGYLVKFENCFDFVWFRDGVKIRLVFIKNGEPKNYVFEDSNYNSYVRDLVTSLHKGRVVV